MPRESGRKKGKKRQGGGGGGVNITAGSFRMSFPIPRLPSWLGAADRLKANAAVYPRVDLDFPIILQNVAVVAGAMATVIAVDPNVLVPNWSSRVQNLFREYCVVGLRIENSLTIVANPAGCIISFIDETLATAPGTGSIFVPHIEIPLVASPSDDKTQLVNYKPSGSYTDLQWTPVSSPVVRQWVKYYASTPQTGTGATTAATVLVRGTIALAFRGYANY